MEIELVKKKLHIQTYVLLNLYFRGVIVPGGFGKRGMEGKIAAVTWCRTTRKPFLGVCLGLQAAVIEFTR